MGVVMLQVLGLVLKVCAFTCCMVIHALAAFPNGEGMPGLLYDENVLISIAPVADPPSYGTGFQPPLIIPPRSSGPVPQSTKGLNFSPRLSPLSTPPPNILVPPTTSIQRPVPAMPPVPPPEEPPHTEHIPPPSVLDTPGRAVSIIGSGPSSPSFSLSSSIAAYTASAKTFSLSDVERATDHFNETRILGEGGFGMVYSGMLEDGTKVAMKILKRSDQQGGREFFAEVEMLSRLHHRNLVKLIGICVEDRTRCLVYELIPNGCVESHLHGIDKESAPLDWSARLKIALGAARALAYLHEDSSPRVIHRDFKASNILLEDDYTPKVSDFGLARTALEEENRHISTRVMGTFGYVAPEYAMTGHLLVKSDVYSYGVVLLELLTGKKPIDLSQPPGQENLVSWSRPLLTSREGLESIIDPSLGPKFPFDSIAKVAAIASMCVQPEVSHRPFMGEVVQALKLVYNECGETKEDMEARNSTNSDRLPDLLLNQSPISDYDYRLDPEKDLSMSELLSSSAKPGRHDLESFRWNSSSGPLRTSSASRLWRTMRLLSGGSVRSEHRMLLRLRPGSH